MTAMPLMILPTLSRRTCKGVFFCLVSVRKRAILPICVCMPVSVTMATALPAVTRQPENTILARSPSGISPSSCASASFSAGTLSPVNEDSSTARLSDLRRRASAGTRSPVFNRMISPGTRCLGSHSPTEPSRSTRQTGEERLPSASRAFSALRSCVTARMTFITMTAKTTSGSMRLCSPSHSMIAIVRLRTAAMSRMMTDTSLSCARILTISLVFFSFSKAFGPYSSSRDDASCAVSPLSCVTPCSASSSAAVFS